MSERVQKVLSQWGIASRRTAEKMIVEGKVKINGRVAKLGDKIDLTVDRLLVNGKAIEPAHRPQQLYLLLNKPVGVISSCQDPQKRTTVIDLLPRHLRQGTGIHPVGRLDFASSGALILTNDGKFTLGLTHPRYHLPKTYIVKLNRSPTWQDLNRWRKGIVLDETKTLPAEVSQIVTDKTAKTLKIVLIEGKNRQIRRVARQLGYRVEQLHRIAIGSITLHSNKNGELPAGKYRHLQPEEVNFLYNSFNPTHFTDSCTFWERSV